jgi:hypothetical protein
MKTGIGGIHLNIAKDIYDKVIASKTLNREKLSLFRSCLLLCPRCHLGSLSLQFLSSIVYSIFVEVFYILC